MKTTGLPTSFNPLLQQFRTEQADKRVQARATELRAKTADGTIKDDKQYRDMLETHQKWMSSNAMQSFNPLNFFRGGMTSDQVMLREIVGKAYTGDAEAALQAQHNMPALQALALGTRLGVPYEKVENYLVNAGAQALATGDLATYAHFTRALGGLEAATALFPAYKQAERSIPTHKREASPAQKKPPATAKKDEPPPPPPSLKEGEVALSAFLKTAKAGVKKTQQTPEQQASAMIAGLFDPSGRMAAARGATFSETAVHLPYKGFALDLRDDGVGHLVQDGKSTPLSKNDVKAVLSGMVGWAHLPGVVSPPALETMVGRALSADIKPEQRKALRESNIQLVDARTNIIKSRWDREPVHPLAAQISFHDVELKATPKEAAKGTLLVDPGSGSVRMRSGDGTLYDVALEDQLRMYQMLRLRTPPEGGAAFLENLEAAILRAQM
ncbi:MAG: hypothetical protein U1E65_00145 [Myxococcota bacterium]